MIPAMIDVFGRELIVTSMDRSMVVSLDKFMGLADVRNDSEVFTIVRSETIHVGDVSVVHLAKPYLSAEGELLLL